MEDSPLWRESAHGADPASRGLLLLLAAVVALALVQFATAAGLSLADGAALILGITIAWNALWFQLYLICAGVPAARWLFGPMACALGVAEIAWGFLHLNIAIALGAVILVVGATVGFAPPVLAFAERQRERFSFGRFLLTSVFFAAIIGLTTLATSGFATTKAYVEATSVRFAKVSFDRIFLERDLPYLVGYSSDEPKASTPQQFVERITNELQDLEQLEPPRTTIVTKVDWTGFHVRNETVWHAHFRTAVSVWITMRISGGITGWRIDHVGWIYR